MDVPIKRILVKTQQQGKHENETLSSSSSSSSSPLVTGVNSYNIGRPLMQMVHYIWTYCRVVEQVGGETPPGGTTNVDMVLPTGAMGNIAGGYIAKQMGIPIGLLCSGVNANDITHRVMSTGQFHKSEMKRTLSEAINVQIPYNFERLLYFLTDRNHELVKQWMTTIDTTSKLDLDASWLLKLQAEFKSARVSDEEMCETIRKLHKEYGYLLDPHGAVAMTAAEKLGYKINNDNTTPVAILATASPCKFQQAVTVAIGKEGWDEYFATSFPPKALETWKMEETDPIVYEVMEGETLEKAQKRWETTCDEIMEKLREEK